MEENVLGPMEPEWIGDDDDGDVTEEGLAAVGVPDPPEELSRFDD